MSPTPPPYKAPVCLKSIISEGQHGQQSLKVKVTWAFQLRRRSVIKTQSSHINKIHYNQSLTACRPQKEFFNHQKNPPNNKKWTNGHAPFRKKKKKKRPWLVLQLWKPFETTLITLTVPKAYLQTFHTGPEQKLGTPLHSPVFLIKKKNPAFLKYKPFTFDWKYICQGIWSDERKWYSDHGLKNWNDTEVNWTYLCLTPLCAVCFLFPPQTIKNLSKS